MKRFDEFTTAQQANAIAALNKDPGYYRQFAAKLTPLQPTPSIELSEKGFSLMEAMLRKFTLKQLRQLASTAQIKPAIYNFDRKSVLAARIVIISVIHHKFNEIMAHAAEIIHYSNNLDFLLFSSVLKRAALSADINIPPFTHPLKSHKDYPFIDEIVKEPGVTKPQVILSEITAHAINVSVKNDPICIATGGITLAAHWLDFIDKITGAQEPVPPAINPKPEPKPEPEPEPEPEPMKEPTMPNTPAPASSGLEGALSALIQNNIGTTVKDELDRMGITKTKVKDLIMEVVKEKSLPTIVQRASASSGEPQFDLVHNKLSEAQFYLDLGFSIYLNGPAGSGKTQAARQLAEHYKVDFTLISAHGEMTVYDLVGYNDGNGNYNPTPFYNAWKEGHLLIIDEVDKAPGEVTVFLNAATEQGILVFPNGEKITKKDSCRIILTGNTKMMGADSIYSSAQKQDGSFANRLWPIDWPFDERLEEILAIRSAEMFGGTQAQAKRIHEKILKIRKAVEDFGMNYIVGQRQTMMASAAHAAGKSVDEALEVVFGWMSSGDRTRVIKEAL